MPFIAARYGVSMQLIVGYIVPRDRLGAIANEGAARQYWRPAQTT